jgi:hypothetical protein
MPGRKTIGAGAAKPTERHVNATMPEAKVAFTSK